MSMRQDRFCGNCGNPRSPDETACARCGMQFGVSDFDLGTLRTYPQSPHTIPVPNNLSKGADGSFITLGQILHQRRGYACVQSRFAEKTRAG
jgi:hypothetical protein